MLTNHEFKLIMEDLSKRIEGDIVWQEDEDHSPAIEFRAEVQSERGWPLFLKGSYNPVIPALSYVLIHARAGRIYGLDMGKDHHNPQCHKVGEIHKHLWKEELRDKEAYRPDDITMPVENPVAVWYQFCVEAKLMHQGNIEPPPFREEV